jgi:hypothetical protein
MSLGKNIACKSSFILKKLEIFFRDLKKKIKAIFRLFIIKKSLFFLN